MDPMVSARVPAGLRDTVNQGLREIGSSPTELINSAYEYFLSTRALPKTNSPHISKGRKLSAQDKQQLRESIAATSHKIPESFFKGLSYEELLTRNLRSDYEALS